MKKYFLVDYENVESSGLEGFDKLSKEDVVEVFYTEKANRVSIEFLELYLALKDNAPRLILTKVAKGNQALDMQLSSYLGSLVAAQQNDECAFVIVSKDKGYGVLQQFWKKKRPDISITQQSDLKSAQEPKSSAQEPKEPAKADEALNPAETAEKKETSGQRNPSRRKNNPKTKPLPEQKDQPKQSKELSPQDGADASEPAAKPEAPQSHSEARTQLNNQIITILSKAKCESKEMGIVASLVVNSVPEANPKTAVYRGLVSKFGQKKGLEFYRLIKSCLP